MGKYNHILSNYSILIVNVKVTSTGQLNTILTFFEISSPSVKNPLSGIPITLLRRVVTILGKTGRGQIIEGVEGGGARFFTSNING